MFLSPEEATIFVEGQEVMRPLVSRFAYSSSSEIYQPDHLTTKNDQAEVHEMNLRCGKKIPDPTRDKGKRKISQPVEGSKAMESPKDISLSGAS